MSDPVPRLEREALLALYQADRSDTIALMGHALQLIGVGVAYLVAAVTAALSLGETPPDWVLILLPAPAWAAVSFHVLLNALVWARNVSMGVLEEQMVQRQFRLPGDPISVVGVVAGTLVTDLNVLQKRERWPLAVATYISYGGAGALIVVLTVVSLAQAAENSPVWSAIAGATYLTCAVALAGAWRVVLTKITRAGC